MAIDRVEYLAQMGRLRMTPPALARKAGVSVNTVRNFLAGGDIRLGHLLAITEALSGDLHVTFAKVMEPGVPPADSNVRWSVSRSSGADLNQPNSMFENTP
jgi:hypothetical protein